MRPLNQAVKRNKDRFPNDFMYQLSTDEWKAMRESNWPQIVTSSTKFRGDTYLPYAEVGLNEKGPTFVEPFCGLDGTRTLYNSNGQKQVKTPFNVSK